MDLIIGILAGFVIFVFGIIMGRSFTKYDGVINIEDTETGGKLYSLVLDDIPESLDQRKKAIFKIQPNNIP